MDLPHKNTIIIQCETTEEAGGDVAKWTRFVARATATRTMLCEQIGYR
jgi:hypothetical protein